MTLLESIELTVTTNPFPMENAIIYFLDSSFPVKNAIKLDVLL